MSKKIKLSLIIVLSILAFIFCAKKNEVPEAPSITGPAEGWVGEEDTFFVSGTDIDEDSLSYLINWGDGNYTLWSDYFASGDTVNFFHAFAIESTYSIYSLAKDINDDTSNWSNAHEIAIFKEILVKWQYESPPVFLPSNSPAVGEDGTIYVVLGDILYAISPSGVEIWFQIFNNCYVSSPSIDDNGTIYVGVSNGEGEFVAFNPDGSTKWTYPVGFPTGGAISSDGTVYLGSSDSCLYALNPDDGSLKWFYKSSGRVYCTPIIGQSGNIYFGTSDGYYYAIDSNGDYLWKLQLSTNLVYSYWQPGAISDDETIYTTVDNGELYALNSDGSITWHISIGPEPYYKNSPIIGTDGTICIGSESGFYAISQNGTILWQYPKECCGAAAFTSNNLVIGILEYEIYTMNSAGNAKGRSKNLIATAYCAPAISNEGTIYVVGEGQILYALESQGNLASSAWPMYQHDARHTGRAE